MILMALYLNFKQSNIIAASIDFIRTNKYNVEVDN